MNNLQIFDNPEFGQMRTIELEGEPWFVGKDVAAALGYKEPTKAAREKVEAEDRGVSEIDTPSGPQEMTIINESGLYSLVLSSKLPGAKKFKRWVTSEVLPAIRRTGGYIAGADMSSLSPQLQAMINMELRLKEQDKQIEELKADVNKQEKKLERVVDVFSIPAVSKDMWQKDTNRYISDLCEEYGLNHQTTRGNLYRELEDTARVSLSARVKRKQKRMKEAGARYKEWHDISKLEVIAEDEKLRPIFEGICRKLAAQMAFETGIN